MPKPIILKCDRQTEPERWKEIRLTGIGGSEAAMALGVSRYGGPFTLFLRKTGQSPEHETNEMMLWGNLLEEPIAREFSRRTGIKVRKANVILRHPTHPFMLATLDRWAEEDGERGILEVKTASEYKAEEWEDGRVPDEYMIQVQHYMAVTDTDFAWLAPLIGGNRLKPVRVERNDVLIKQIIKGEREFWNLVQSRTPPATDGSAACSQVLRLCYPQSEPNKVLTMGTDEQEAYGRLLGARKVKKEAEEDERLAKNQLIAWLQDAEAATLPGASEPAVTYKGVASKRLDSKSLALAHPDIAAPYYVESTSRRFVVGREEE